MRSHAVDTRENALNIQRRVVKGFAEAVKRQLFAIMLIYIAAEL